MFRQREEGGGGGGGRHPSKPELNGENNSTAFLRIVRETGRQTDKERQTDRLTGRERHSLNK